MKAIIKSLNLMSFNQNIYNTNLFLRVFNRMNKNLNLKIQCNVRLLWYIFYNKFRKFKN